MNKIVNVREFGLMCDEKFMSDHEIIFTISNQTKEYKSRHEYVSEDRRVFDNILIALNPDSIKFCNSTNKGCLAITGIDRITINPTAGDEFYFYVICNIKHIGKEVFVFLAKKKD